MLNFLHRNLAKRPFQLFYDATGRFETFNYQTLEVSCFLRKMKDTEVLSKLEEITRQLGLDLRWEDGHFTGGTCHLGNKMMFIINSSLPTFQKVEVLCRELSHFDLSQIFILPDLRDRIHAQVVRDCSSASTSQMGS